MASHDRGHGNEQGRNGRDWQRRKRPEPGHGAEGRSRPVSSRQRATHPRLREVVLRHAAQPWRRPLHAPTREAFRFLEALVSPDERQGLLLDSGCGTGASSVTLARRHPDRLVLGVDRSAHRLTATAPGPWPWRRDNLVLLRGELATCWRLLLGGGWRPAQHWLLYPNPWPKPGQLRRRWHAHPVFPTVLSLGGHLVLRCNWAPYAEEFDAAVHWLTGLEPSCRQVETVEPMSPFERKYAASGHKLFEVSVVLEAGKGPPGTSQDR